MISNISSTRRKLGLNCTTGTDVVYRTFSNAQGQEGQNGGLSSCLVVQQPILDEKQNAVLAGAGIAFIMLSKEEVVLTKFSTGIAQKLYLFYLAHQLY